jgi:hypothetical protein
VYFTSREFTVTYLCSSGRNAIEGCTTTPSQATVLRAKTATLSLCMSLTHAQVWNIGDDCRPLSVTKQAGCILAKNAHARHDVDFVFDAICGGRSCKLAMRTQQLNHVTAGVTRRQVCLSVPAIDARGGSQILVLNALQATRRETTGLSFG